MGPCLLEGLVVQLQRIVDPLFPPPTIFLVISHLNNSPSEGMGSHQKPNKHTMGVIDFSSIPSSSGSEGSCAKGGRIAQPVCTHIHGLLIHGRIKPELMDYSDLGPVRHSRQSVSLVGVVNWL